MKQKDERQFIDEAFYNNHDSRNMLLDSGLQRNKDTSLNYDNIEPHRHLVAIQVRNKPEKFGKFVRLFHCIAGKTMDDGKKIPGYCATIHNENVIILDCVKNGKDDAYSVANSDISNSSLRDVENGALQAELDIYMCDILSNERGT